MTTPAGLCFDETLSGGFAPGKSDPGEGRDAGLVSGSALTIRNHITIADVDAFYADREHTAALEVELDFSPFGTGIRGTGGTFNLFKPGPREDRKLMVYRFGFDHDGASYTFAGRKFIHDGSSARTLWEESTHLYARIHEGAGEDGPVVAAGVVAIGVWGVIDLVRSMRVTGTDSKVRQAEVLATFGSFFFGALWDAYRTHLFGKPTA